MLRSYFQLLVDFRLRFTFLFPTGSATLNSSSSLPDDSPLSASSLPSEEFPEPFLSSDDSPLSDSSLPSKEFPESLSSSDDSPLSDSSLPSEEFPESKSISYIYCCYCMGEPSVGSSDCYS